MKKIITLLLTATMMAGALAQTPKVQWGPELKTKKKEPVVQIIGVDGKYIYVRKKGMSLFNYNKEIFEKYSTKELSLVSSEEILLPEYKGNKLNFMRMVMLNNEVRLFSSKYIHDKEVSYICTHKIDAAKSQVLEPVLINEVNTKRSLFSMENKILEFSPDSSKVLIFHEPSSKNNDNVAFKITVLDDKFDLIWEEEIDLPYDNKLVDARNVEVSNTGEVFLQAKVYEGKVKDKVRGKANYSYSVFAFREKGQDTKEYKISLGDNFINNLIYKIADNGNIVCAGYFSEKGTTNMKGTFFMTIDPETKAVLKKGTKEFDTEFLAQFMKERKAAKGKELVEFVADEIILRSDGGAVLVGEQFYVHTVTYTTTSSSGAVSTRSRTYYNYNDIIVTNINPNGSIAWNVQIPKKQVSVEDGGPFSSYVMAVRGEKIHILYNDNPKNINVMKGRDAKSVSFSSAAITMATIDASGKMTKSLLLSNKDIGTIFMPKISKQVSDRELILFAQKGKKYKLGRLYL